MKLIPIKHAFRSTTVRLASTYLMIIMSMSLGFSLVFYYTSQQQLNRQLPPDSWMHHYDDDDTFRFDDDRDRSNPNLSKYLQDRIYEGVSELRYKLVILNIGALIIGSLLSYELARRTLKPIEEAMEAQAQFVSDASHELRTPLSAIQTSNEVALRRPNLTLADAKALIASNTEDIERLKRLSDSLLTLARYSKGDLLYVPIKLQDIVSEAMTQVVPQATTKRIAVHDEVANLTVIGNKTGLVQVLVILLDNAIKYSGRKSDIYLKTRLKGKYVYLDVIDQGIGIRASDLPHLFRRFFRADHSRTNDEQSGYGLGLAIAERIMLNHDGRISVKSKAGEGSTFTLQLHVG